MRGTIFKRTYRSGRSVWCFELDAGEGENGRRIRISRAGFARESDADSELSRLKAEKTEGLLVRPNPTTFGEFMREWFREHAEHNCEPKTVERYRQLAGYVLPQLESVALQDLSALMLERLYNQLRKSGGQRKRRRRRGEQAQPAPLSAKTVQHIAGLVHGALEKAVRWKLLRMNPADAVEIKAPERKEARALDAVQTDWYLDAARGHWLHPILVTAAATGCRRGELLALRWADLTLGTAPPVVSISRSLEQTRTGLRIKAPKNGKTRALALPAISVEALAAHRQQQEEYRRQFGPDYRADLNLVFATPEGDYLKPDTVTAAACLLARKVGLKGIGLHSLRHSHGSQLLAAGASLPTVSKRLGHSSVYVTATVYSHAFSRDEVAAAELWNTAMQKAGEGQRMKQ